MINWILSNAPSELGKLAAFAMKMMFFMVTCLGHLLDFPIVNLVTLKGKWEVEAIPACLVWIVWYTLLTQPKKVDDVANKVTDWLAEMATKIWDFLFPKGGKGHPWIALMIGIAAFPILVFALVFRRKEIVRLVLTLGIANLLASPQGAKLVANKVLGSSLVGAEAIWAGWMIILLVGIILLLIWWFRDDEWKVHASRVIRTKGWVWGILRLLVEDFIPISTWTCESCGFSKNRVRKGSGPTEACGNCGHPNPDADWKCGCGETNHPHDHFCEKCGKPRPTTASPEPTASTTAPTPPPPATDTNECPRCHSDVPEGQAHCGSCGASVPSKRDRDLLR